MFDKIKDFFQTVIEKDSDIHFDENDQRLAAAALLTHVMFADGVVRDVEREAIENSLQKRYDLSPDVLKELLKEGEEADQTSVDFYSFTSVLKRELNRDERENIVEMLWDVVLADGVIHELEDNVVWRVAELLGIETRARIHARQRAEARIKTEPH